MTEKKNMTITLVNSSKLARAVQRTITVTLVFVLPICIGIAVHSSAMQWAGFIFGLLIILVMAVSHHKENTFSTVDAAKRRLEELKASGEAE